MLRIIAVLASLVLAEVSAGAASAQPAPRSRERALDMPLRQSRPAPRRGDAIEGYAPTSRERVVANQRLWFGGPNPSVNDSLQGLPPNVIDPPNVRSPGERSR